MGNLRRATAWLFASSLAASCTSGDHVQPEHGDTESSMESGDTALDIGRDHGAWAQTATAPRPDEDGQALAIARIRAGEYAVRRRTSDLRARNRAQRFEAIWRDGATRVQLTPKEEAARPFSREDRDARAKGQLARPADAVGLELRTVAVARGAERVQIPAGEFSVGSCRQDGAVDEMGECLRRAEARSSVLVEWWENRPDGLEQGFDLERAPLASDGQPLRLELRVEGADVRVDEDGQGATLTLPDGEELRYTGLLAKDARQSSLPILLSASGGGLSIEIQDRGATYPLHVDPLLATPLVYESNQDRHS